MSVSTFIGRSLAERLGKIHGSARRVTVRAIVLIALGVVGLMEKPATATAAYAVAATFGGLLLLCAVAVRRSSHERCKSLLELRPVRGRLVPHRSRDHR